MSAVKPELVGVEVDRPQAERMSAEDRATARDAEFLADALATQRLLAQRQGEHARGRCANCGSNCSPQAVYCDEDCKADHEQREAALRRQGRAR